MLIRYHQAMARGQNIMRPQPEQPVSSWDDVGARSTRHTGLIYLSIRVLVNALALVLAMLLTPGISIRIHNPHVPLALATLLIGGAFGLLNTVVRPLLLLLTERIVVRTVGLFLFVNQIVLFAILDLLFHTFTVSPPAWLWIALASVIMTILVFLLEALFGLDSPMIANRDEGAFYWRWLNLLGSGQHNRVTESLRLGQILEIFSRYAQDLAFQQTPLERMRLFMQDVLYGRGSTVSELSPPAKVRLMLQELGPTFVKLGQIASSRPEVIPPEWRTELEKLQNAVPPVSEATARRIIRQELHKPPEGVFASFEAAPFAAASTAQVHRATLLDGTLVAVKIQRPDIDVTMKADLNVMRYLAAQLDRTKEWARNLNLKGLTNEFADGVLIELDLRNEAANGRTLAHNMRDVCGVHVPAIYTELSTSRILTEEFVRGVKITAVDRIDAAGLHRSELARTFLQAMIKQILIDRFFHGDPHPGNVLVNLDTSEIIFLDLGMMGELTRQKQLALIELIWTLREHDVSGLVSTFRALSIPYKQVDEERYRVSMERFIQRAFSDDKEHIRLSGLISGAIATLTRAGLRLDQDLTLALKALIQGEEIFATLDPASSGELVRLAGDTVAGYLREQVNLDTVMRTVRTELTRAARELVGHVPSLSEALIKWVEQYEKGQLIVHLDTGDLPNRIASAETTIRRSGDRLMLGLMLAGLIVGSAIASSAQLKATVFNVSLSTLAFDMFVVSAIVGAVLVVRGLVGTTDESAED
jgi:ubiquinone biosynthesis protein